jgi:hypothetical protein
VRWRAAQVRVAGGPRGGPRGRPPPPPPPGSGGEPEARREEQPRHRRHRVAFVLPAYLAVQAHRHEPQRRAGPEQGGKASRGTEHEPHCSKEPHRPPKPSLLAEVVVCDPEHLILQVEHPGRPHLARGHVRVVEFQFHQATCRGGVSGEEAVGEGVRQQHARRGHARQRQRPEGAPGPVRPVHLPGGRDAEQSDHRRRFGARSHEKQAGHAQGGAVGATDGLFPCGAPEIVPSHQARGPQGEEQGHLHPTEERPVQGADAEQRRWSEVAARRREAVIEPPRAEQGRQHAHAGHDRRPDHQIETAKSEEISEGQHEGIEQARPAARVTVALGPLERIAARRGAGEIEVDEDVVQGGRPGAVPSALDGSIEGLRCGPELGLERLVAQRRIEEARDHQNQRPRPQGVELRLVWAELEQHAPQGRHTGYRTESTQSGRGGGGGVRASLGVHGRAGL